MKKSGEAASYRPGASSPPSAACCCHASQLFPSSLHCPSLCCSPPLSLSFLASSSSSSSGGLRRRRSERQPKRMEEARANPRTEARPLSQSEHGERESTEKGRERKKGRGGGMEEELAVLYKGFVGRCRLRRREEGLTTAGLEEEHLEQHRTPAATSTLLTKVICIHQSRS